METQKTPNSESSLNNNRAGGIRLQTILQSYGDQTVWYWHKNRNIDQWNWIASPEINLHICGHLLYDNEGKNI